MKDFLPICPEDMKKRGWDQADFVYVIGDAYVDHSSFGPAIISRVLESRGYKVAIISQPDYSDPQSIAVFGKPRLGFLVSAGNMDSMVNHYTVNKKPRSTDSYSPGGKAGLRPNYATIVYCNLINRLFKDSPVIIGGIEASLRRLAHYDYWSDKLKRSILLDSGADLLLYGMGELSIVEVADALNSGLDVSDITFIPGTVYKTRDVSSVEDGIVLPDFDALKADKLRYAESFYIQYCNAGYATAKPLIEKYGENRYVVQNPPQRPLTTMEMDDVYQLPYMNTYHPVYEKDGGVPAINEIKFSLTSNRGCFGACSFCALTFHQGRIVQARSHESLINEAKAMTGDPDFKGYIHDVGGPTADFRRPSCDKQLKAGVCTDRQCLFPKPCPNLKADHSDYISLLRKLRAIDGVKKVFIRSGIRFDYVLADKKGDDFIEEICRYHVSGQLRVAPEHVSDNVLKLMGKPENSVYREFIRRFDRTNRRLGLDQYAVPYLISSHPGSTLKDAVALAESIRDMGYMPEQVQDFYPTPSTISTVMYYTGVDPRTMEKVYVPSDPREKAMQRALIQYRKPENYELVREALVRAGRQDLIGWDRKHCLIPPRQPQGSKTAAAKQGRSASGPRSGKGGKGHEISPSRKKR
ncbi:MAG: YgiQ family radical SAM protein [Firmicutes bacterium]|nr:YgiQ family radical SAM protein [Bacillota bacterium]MBQ6013185.1 YgiQ family radical SAM protein [Bacillota bacterium]MBQ6261775.1 YgiQ family radical SAM protein [Bacillota bacterium]